MKSKWAIAVTIIIAVAVIATVALMMNRDSQPAEFSLRDGQLVISCSFGVSVPLEEIAGLELTETVPEIDTRTNGASVGCVHKGEYKLAGGNPARLYIDASVPPFIRFTQGDTVFYISAGNAEATRALYADLLAAAG